MAARPAPFAFAQKDRCQQLVIDAAGRILESDDSLFSTKRMADEPVFGRFPVFEGIWPGLFLEKMDSAATVLDAVQQPGLGLEGIYDLRFSPIFWQSERAVRCEIFDRTEHYLLLREQQQAENDAALTREKAALAR